LALAAQTENSFSHLSHHICFWAMKRKVLISIHTYWQIIWFIMYWFW